MLLKLLYNPESGGLAQRQFWILAHMSQHFRSNPDSRDSSTGSVRPFRAMGARQRHWNTMVAAECAIFSWHLLGLSFSFPNWPESHDVRRHRCSLLAWFFWQISCLFAPWALGL
jgi:hypothetical protein